MTLDDGRLTEAIRFSVSRFYFLNFFRSLVAKARPR
jgi:hypothetical protein